MCAPNQTRRLRQKRCRFIRCECQGRMVNDGCRAIDHLSSAEPVWADAGRDEHSSWIGLNELPDECGGGVLLRHGVMKIVDHKQGSGGQVDVERPNEPM